MARQLLRRTLINSQAGPEDASIASDAGNGTISISGGGQRVLTPGGHLIVVDSPIDSVTIPSAEVPSPVYVVGLVYEETTTSRGPNAISAAPQDRESVASTRAVVYSAAQYSALPATTTDSAGNTTFGQVSKDRLAIVAYGQYDSTGTLQVTVPEQLSSALRAARTANSGSSGALTGVELVRFSSNTSPSDPFPEAGTADDGQLRLAINSTGTTATLAYKAPGDALGSTVSVVSLDDATEQTLTSSTTSYTLTVRVYPSMFPPATGSAETYIDDLTVSDLYGGLTIGGGKDVAHRGLLGSGLPTANNPHGLTLDDVAILIDEIRGSVNLGRDLDASDEAHVPHLNHRPNAATAAVGTVGYALKRQYVGNTSTGAVNIREYLDNKGRLVVTTNAAWNHGASPRVWEADQAGSTDTATKRSYGGTGQTLTEVLQVKQDTSTAWEDTAWNRAAETRTIESATGQDTLEQPNTQLSLGANLLGTTANANRPRVLLPMSVTNGRRTWLVDSTDETPTALSRTATYRAKGSTSFNAGPSFTEAYEHVAGARWDGSNWQLNGTNSLRALLAPNGFGVGAASGGGAISDSGWGRVLSWDPATGLVIPADIEVTGTTTFTGDVDLDGTTTVNGTLGIPGNLSVGSLTLTTSSPSPAAINTVYTQSIVKGWAVIDATLDNGGGPTYVPSANIVYNFNMAAAGSGLINTGTAYRDDTCAAIELELVTGTATADRLCPVITHGVTSAGAATSAEDNESALEVTVDGSGVISIFRGSSTDNGATYGFSNSVSGTGWSTGGGEILVVRIFLAVLGGP